MTVDPQYRKKLIEVALPLEAINKESSREKSIRHGHPSTLHLWWARRPLTACRAVLFASLVDDPSSWPEIFPTEAEQEKERKRIFAIIEELAKWENSNNSDVLYQAHEEIARSISRGRGDPMPKGIAAIRQYITENAPPVLDPFCGGGSIPLEAQRLGLEVQASDLNPVAVLITKALIEIPPKFAGKPAVNPMTRTQKTIEEKWEGVKGLADDVEYYGKWMRSEAEKRIGHFYPRVKITAEIAKDRPDLKKYIGKELTIIAWLWARTVASSNPIVNRTHVPLVRSYWLSTKPGKEAWIEPIIDKEKNQFKFVVRVGSPYPDKKIIIDSGTKIGRGCNFKCIISGEPIPDSHVKKQGALGQLNVKLIAIVAEGDRGRVYLSPSEDQEKIANSIIKPGNIGAIQQPMVDDKRNIWCYIYGFTSFDKLFTSRQLLALATFSNLVQEVREKILADANKSLIFPADERRLDEGGTGAKAYADAVSVYLTFPIGRAADYWATTSTWYPANQQIGHTFTRQAIPMVWDFAEANPLSNSSGGWISLWSTTLDAFKGLPIYQRKGSVKQLDATSSINGIQSPIISTDPPYYDNIGYADLSDFFYIWLRRSLSDVFPSLFATVLTPKIHELIASPHRHDGKRQKAQVFFEEGLGRAFLQMKEVQNADYPLTVFYAFKQVEECDEEDSIVSTGWDTMLTGLIRAGYMIEGTWPMRSEQHHRMIAHSTNALASSIVLVCRPRSPSASLATRREFIASLKHELPSAVKTLQKSSIAPVDLAQSAIGPGMAVFSRYARIMESDGSPMTVRTALGIINQTLDEVFAEQEGEFDADTRWALSWYEQYRNNEGPFGDAETLSKAKNTAVNGLIEAGIITAKGGKVKILNWNELREGWDPNIDRRPTIWEATHYLIKQLENHGEQGAADLLQKLGGGMGENARDLCYRLYSICERKKWAQDAIGYNSLIVAWPEITKLVQSSARTEKAQRMLLGEE